MRVLLLLCLFVLTNGRAQTSAASAGVRAEMEQAIKTFRTEGPKGWSFSQTTEGDGHSRVERYEPTPADLVLATSIGPNSGLLASRPGS